MLHDGNPFLDVNLDKPNAFVVLLRVVQSTDLKSVDVSVFEFHTNKIAHRATNSELFFHKYAQNILLFSYTILSRGKRIVQPFSRIGRFS